MMLVHLLLAGSFDYEEANFTKDLGMFAPNPACVQLTVLDDPEPEPEEEFFVCIESLSPSITATGDCAVVHIIDDDSKHMCFMLQPMSRVHVHKPFLVPVHPVPLIMIAWSEARYVVSEGQKSLEVCVELVGPLSDLAQVTLSTMDYSAVGMSDISVSHFPAQQIVSTTV